MMVPGHSNFVPSVGFILPGQQPDIFSFGFPMNGSFEIDATQTKNSHIASPGIRPVLLMLADDDVDDRELFAEAIKEQEIPVVLEFAEDGLHLLKRLQEKHKQIPDVLFLDLNMPNKSGLECLEQIRMQERLKNISVVIYSTSSSQKDINDTYSKGANLYVRKPSTFKDLREITSRILRISWEQYQPNAERNNFVFQANIN